MRGPVKNGSSSSTLEILLGLTFAGASVLTVLALLARDRQAERDAPPTDPPEEPGETED